MAAPSNQLELKISCTNLRSADILSKSDPVCVVFLFTNTGEWLEAGRTEAIMNNHNPVFKNRPKVDLVPTQRVKFIVYDHDPNKAGSVVPKSNYLGTAETKIGDLIASNVWSAQLDQSGKKGDAMIYVDADPAIDGSAANLKMAVILKADKLSKGDLFGGKSDPYFTFSRADPGDKFTQVHKSETIKNVNNPQWKAAEINLKELCNCNLDHTIRIQVWDHDTLSKDDLIGEIMTTVRQLRSSVAEKRDFLLINPKKANSKNYKNSGILIVQMCSFIA